MKESFDERVFSFFVKCKNQEQESVEAHSEELFLSQDCFKGVKYITVTP